MSTQQIRSWVIVRGREAGEYSRRYTSIEVERIRLFDYVGSNVAVGFVVRFDIIPDEAPSAYLLPDEKPEDYLGAHQRIDRGFLHCKIHKFAGFCTVYYLGEPL